MLVQELQERLVSSPQVPVTAFLSSIDLTEDGQILTPDLDQPLRFDQDSSLILARHLNVSPVYMKKIPLDLAAVNLNYWLNKPVDGEESPVVLQTLGNQLLGISDPNAKALPLTSYIRAVTNTFQPSDEVVAFDVDDKNSLTIDVTTSREIEVLGNGSERRPLVGDITKGGLRLRAFPDTEKPPVVSTYLHRLVCTNGMSIIDPDAKISLRKADDMDELFSSLESTMQNLLEDINNKLEYYAGTAQTPIVGDRALMIFNMAAERNLPRNVLQQVMDLGSELPENASIYDLMQVFTEVANSQKPQNRFKLQELGGALSSPHSNILHRCQTCSHSLVDYDQV